MKEFLIEIDEGKLEMLVDHLDGRIASSEHYTKMYEHIGATDHPDYKKQMNESAIYRNFADLFYGAFPGLKRDYKK